MTLLAFLNRFVFSWFGYALGHRVRDVPCDGGWIPDRRPAARLGFWTGKHVPGSWHWRKR